MVVPVGVRQRKSCLMMLMKYVFGMVVIRRMIYHQVVYCESLLMESLKQVIDVVIMNRWNRLWKKVIM